MHCSEPDARRGIRGIFFDGPLERLLRIVPAAQLCVDRADGVIHVGSRPCDGALGLELLESFLEISGSSEGASVAVVERRIEWLLREREGRLEVGNGPALLIGLRESLGKAGFGLGVLRLEAQGGLHLGDRVGCVSKLNERGGERLVAFRDLRREMGDARELLPCFFKIAGLLCRISGLEGGVGLLQRRGVLRAGP